MNAREAYKANHSDIRAFGRFARTPEERTLAIAKACGDRLFWLENPRCNASGIAALQTLRARTLSHDVLAMMAEWAAEYREFPAAARSATELRRLSYRFYFSNGHLPREPKPEPCWTCGGDGWSRNYRGTCSICSGSGKAPRLFPR